MEAGALRAGGGDGRADGTAERLRDLASSLGWTLGTGESLTGGLLFAKLTEAPGASAVCHASAVVYSDKAKISILGVRENTLAKTTNVSEQTVREMAIGVVEMLGANVGIATTGFAGPGGKRVGEVWVAVALRICSGKIKCHARMHSLTGSRSCIRLGACHSAMKLALEVLEGEVSKSARRDSDKVLQQHQTDSNAKAPATSRTTC